MYADIRHIILSLVMCLTASAIQPALAENPDMPFTIVIDPGHGGKDVGCEGRKTNEKTIVLDVGRRLGDMISDSLPDVNVVFTRDDNKFLTLQERAAVANNAGGNLFVSIHVNSVDRRNRNRNTICGASVYTLGLHKSDNNLSVAMRENSVMELEDEYSENYQGFDPNSAESYIIFELNQNVHLQKSLEFADAVQQQLTTTAGRADKGVRQAGFWVLWATSMPAVLIELDFICNPDSENFMASVNGRELLAKAIFNAFSAYYHRNASGDHGPSVGRQVALYEPVPESDAEPIKNKKKSVADKNKITYHVQILSSRKKLPKNDHEIKKVKDVGFVRDGKFYKYYSGTFDSENEAKSHLRKLKKRFRDAFVIKIKDGKII